jgi:ribosomal protein L11 methyltransferase
VGAAEPSLVRVTVSADPGLDEALQAEAAVRWPAGVELVAPGVVAAYEAADVDASAIARSVSSAHGAPVEAAVEAVPPGWADAWRAFHRPVRVGRLVVRPPWEPRTGAPALDLVIEPAQAFGTGAHATTRACLELLLDEPPGPWLDLGCGSGVLALAAALAGHAPVTGVDAEEAAVAAARENAARNGLGRRVRFDRWTLLPGGGLPAAERIVANLQLEPLLVLAEALRRPGAARPRTLVLSGLLMGQDGTVVAALAGYRLRRRRPLDGWVALALDRIEDRG